jgi:ABC-type multidrug transport system fused ATPase/permease subunit
MKKTIKVGILKPKDSRNIIFLFVLALVTAIFETAGVLSIFPLISLIAKPEIIHQNTIVNTLYKFVNPQSEQWFLIYLSFGLLGVTIVSLFLKSTYYHYQYKFSLNLERDIGVRLLDGYIKKSYLWHTNKHSSELVKNILSQTSIVIAEVVIPAISTIVHSLIVIFILAVLLWIYPYITITIACIVGVAYALPLFIMKKLAVKTGAERLHANELRFKIAGEALSGVKEVKIFQSENYFTSKFGDYAKKYADKATTGKTLSILPKYILEGFAFGGFLAVIIYSLVNNIDMIAMIPALSTFAAASYKLMPSLQQVYSNSMIISHSLGAYKQLRDELRSFILSDINDDKEELSQIKVSVEFDGVSFSFNPDTAPYIKDALISLPACSSVGLVGPSGSGKSTLVDLLSGLHLPTHGSILCDGKLVTSYNMESWKNKIGYVPQNIFLLDDTIVANIAFGKAKQEVDLDRLHTAAKRANIHEFITNTLSDGYLTVVGERGVRLSGGQRQRIGLARALYKNTEIIILDEATSALDNLTEKLFISNLEELKKDHIILIIAHRLSTIKNCDYIYYVDNGKVICSGNYQDLMIHSSEFRNLSNADHAVNEHA